MTCVLGFRYLWIDSLCILQDQTSDWKAELSRMGDIYRHAALNLAASAGVSSVHGFCLSNRTSNPSPVKIATGRKRTHGATLIDYMFERDVVIFEKNPCSEITTNNLTKRAWVLQEQILVSDEYTET